MSKTALIATRQSVLALWQANYVRHLLVKNYSNIDLFPVVTTGDKMQKTALAEVQLNTSSEQRHLSTGKGLFIKEIQEALLSRKAHIAVHSVKDLPIEQTEGLKIISFLPRNGVRDILILSPQVLEEIKLDILTQEEKNTLSFSDLKKKLLKSQFFCENVIGTTSLRRQMLLKKHFSKNLNLQILRGNVDTRLKRLRNNEFAAIILSEAGLERLSLLNSPDMFPLPPAKFIPAAAQGVIGIECQGCDTINIQNILQIGCKKTALNVGIERLILFILGGDCNSAIGALFQNRTLRIFCATKNMEKEISLKILNNDVKEAHDILTKCNFIYSDYFIELCKSNLAIRIKNQLMNAGFGEFMESAL